MVGGSPVGCPPCQPFNTAFYDDALCYQIGMPVAGTSFGPNLSWNTNAASFAPQFRSKRLNSVTNSNGLVPADLAMPFLAPVWVLGQAASSFQLATTSNNLAGAPPATQSSLVAAVFGDPDVYTSGPSRLISAAYEVHNVSSALNKQGSITIGTATGRTAHTLANFVGAASPSTTAAGFEASQPVEVATISGVPRSSQELASYPNTKIWAAEHGAYAIFPPSDVDNTFEEPTGQAMVQCSLRPYEVTTLGTTPASTLGIAATSARQISVTAGQARGVAPGPGTLESIVPVYTFIEGLNAESVITIVVKLTYETLPYPGTDLAPLARMPDPNDPRPLVFKLYQELSPFCMVAENASGKWFKKLVDTTKRILPVAMPLIRAVAPPGVNAMIDQVGHATKFIAPLLEGDKEVKVQPRKKSAGNSSKPIPKRA